MGNYELGSVHGSGSGRITEEGSCCRAPPYHLFPATRFSTWLLYAFADLRLHQHTGHLISVHFHCCYHSWAVPSVPRRLSNNCEGFRQTLFPRRPETSLHFAVSISPALTCFIIDEQESQYYALSSRRPVVL